MEVSVVTDIQEVYREDTIGRRYHTPTKSKRGAVLREEPPSEVLSLNLNAPIDKEEFRNLSDSLKVIYIQHLRKTFCCTSAQVASMLGYNHSHFSTLVSKLNQKGLFKKGRPNKKQIAAWKKFLKGSEPASENVLKPELKKQDAPAAMFCDCSFTLKGELRVSDIADRIKSMVSDGTQCQISIAINAL